MDIRDNGPNPNAFDLETATVENRFYRQVAWTGKYLQVTLMSIPVGESIGLEVHPDTDQFVRLDAGKGKAVMGPEKDDLNWSQDVSDGWSVQVPAGSLSCGVHVGEGARIRGGGFLDRLHCSTGRFLGVVLPDFGEIRFGPLEVRSPGGVGREVVSGEFGQAPGVGASAPTVGYGSTHGPRVCVPYTIFVTNPRARSCSPPPG